MAGIPRWIPALAGLVLTLTLAVPALRHWREQPPPPPRPPDPVHSTWSPPDTASIGSGGDYSFGLSLAPDGRKLVFPAARSGGVALWLHDLRNGESRELPGTDGAAAPFWSPDGSRIGFFANQHVRVFDVASGQTSDVAEATTFRGGSWNASGDLVFVPASTAGLMLRATDGSIRQLTAVDRSHGETILGWPSFLADGKHVVFAVGATDASRAGTWIVSIDDPLQRSRLLASDSQVILVDDTLVFLNDVALMAQDLDPHTMQLAGRSRVVGVQAGRGPIGQLLATAAHDVLIYSAPAPSHRELRWVTRDGRATKWSSEPIEAWDLRIAPDSKRIVVTEIDRQFRTLDVFLRIATQPAPTRLSLSTDADEGGVWSPDGLRVAWSAQRRKIMIRGAGAVLPEQTIATFDTPVQVWDWSRDGRTLLIGRKTNDNGDDLWLQPPVEGEPAQPYFTGAFNQVYAAISPDGKSIAYASDESGQFDVYVDSFPKPGSRIRVTTAGATEPRWSADGRELFLRRGSEIHAAVLDGPEVRSMSRLFDAGATIRSYDVSRDGRFLINVPADGGVPPQVTLISNWR